MSDPQKPNEGKEFHQRNAHIDDPAMFLSLDSPQPFHQEVINNSRVSSSNSNNQNEFQLGQADEEENKQEDGDLYEPESAIFQGEQEEKENRMDEDEEEYERIPKEKVIQKTHSQAKSNFAQDSVPGKIPIKKKKKSKKKDFDSQEDEYSGEYMVRKKAKAKQTKKSHGSKGERKSDSTRSRGKPRGKGANISKMQEIKREATFLEDPISQKGTERMKNTRKPQSLPTGSLSAPLSFSSSWKIAEDFQQDWDSSNASMWQESINRRAECGILNEMLYLIQQKRENIVAEISGLPPVWYSTL